MIPWAQGETFFIQYNTTKVYTYNDLNAKKISNKLCSVIAAIDFIFWKRRRDSGNIFIQTYLYRNKQEVHRPHRSPEKQVQINKHICLYHNVDLEREKIQYLLFCNQMFGILICKTFSLLLPRMLCVNLVEIGRVVLKTKIFPFCQYIFPISFLVFISPWKWVWLFIWKKTWNEFPSPKNALCQVWLKLAQWFWRRF